MHLVLGPRRLAPKTPQEIETSGTKVVLPQNEAIPESRYLRHDDGTTAGHQAPFAVVRVNLLDCPEHSQASGASDSTMDASVGRAQGGWTGCSRGGDEPELRLHRGSPLIAWRNRRSSPNNQNRTAQSARPGQRSRASGGVKGEGRSRQSGEG